jgi:hypothetical protein
LQKQSRTSFTRCANNSGTAPSRSRRWITSCARRSLWRASPPILLGQPFAAAEAVNWEGAAKRVLRNFGQSLLVPDEHYANIAAWIDLHRPQIRSSAWRRQDSLHSEYDWLIHSPTSPQKVMPIVRQASCARDSLASLLLTND